VMSYEKFKSKVYESLRSYKESVLKITAVGKYRGEDNEMILPDSCCDDVPRMLYDGIRGQYADMQASEYQYKLHLMALKHIASSQTACVNLFMPILLSGNANAILKESGIAPSGFKEIDTKCLNNGFCFEFWNSTDKKSNGLLNDHTQGAGTDADVAIAYINEAGEHCLWLIEHKLTEQGFTTCGGYRSDGNDAKGKCNCKSCSMEKIMQEPSLCYYAKKCGYNYWNLMYGGAKDLFCGKYGGDGCPFRGGMNQLWRNMLLAYAVEKEGVYKHVSFSVVYHPENPVLEKTMKAFSELMNGSDKFSWFTSDKLVAATEKCGGLNDWVEWYRKVYYGEK